MSTQPPLTEAEKKKKKEEEDKKKSDSSLDSQIKALEPAPLPKTEGPTSADAKARSEAKHGYKTGEAKRARSEDAVAAALVKDSVQPTVQTPERKAEAWAKSRNIQFGLGGAPQFYRMVKMFVGDGMTPEQAAEKAAKDMRLIK